MANENEEQQLKLIQLVKEAAAMDSSLREKYQVGDKFRFVRDKLNGVLLRLEKNLADMQTAEALQKKADENTAQDVLVYVYLYNAQGVVQRSWINMLTPKVFYEYSINRPIYSDRKTVDSLVRSKANKMQHAYLTIAINPTFILPPSDKPLQDSAGNKIIRVKEGSLHFNKLISLTHNDEDYVLNGKGELVKKPLE